MLKTLPVIAGIFDMSTRTSEHLFVNQVDEPYQVDDSYQVEDSFGKPILWIVLLSFKTNMPDILLPTSTIIFDAIDLHT